jgi:hypothetical protein
MATKQFGLFLQIIVKLDPQTNPPTVSLRSSTYFLHVALLMKSLATLLEWANKGTISTVKGMNKYLTLIAKANIAIVCKPVNHHVS